jgi:E3 ubiquitin-protein ligase RAD18
MNYLISNEKQLHTILALHDLTHGNKPLLSARHKEYVILFNANLDRRDPVPKRELLQQMQVWELWLQGQGGEGEKRKEIDVGEWERRFAGEFSDLVRMVSESTKRRKMEEDKNNVDERNGDGDGGGGGRNGGDVLEGDGGGERETASVNEGQVASYQL